MFLGASGSGTLDRRHDEWVREQIKALGMRVGRPIRGCSMEAGGGGFALCQTTPERSSPPLASVQKR